MKDLTRRDLCGGAAGLASVSAAGLASAAPARRRPNIVFALADDWSWLSARPVDMLGLRMPNYQRVVRDGLSFDNAFVAAPTCTTSRGSILTGRAPWQLEEGANLASILPAKFAVYPEMLERAGYHVGFAGKGWAPGQLKPAGRARNPAGDAYPDFAGFLAKRPADAPFCFWLGDRDPHRPYVRGQGERNGVSFTGTLPPYLADSPATREDVADYMFAVERSDSHLGVVLAALKAAGELDNTLVVVTGDNGWPFPRGKATLYDAGVHVPLAMMWPGRIKAGGRTRALVTLTDLAPTFLDVAGLPPSPVMTGASLLPVMTGGRWARDAVITAMERHMDGRTQPGQGYPMRALRTERYLFIRNFHPDRWPAGDPPRRAVDAAKLESSVFAGFADIDQGPAKAWLATHPDDPAYGPAVGKRPARELYDVTADPFEMRNLVDDPRHARVLARMDRRLAAELKRLKDPRVGPDGDVFDRYPSYSDPGYGRPADF